MYARPESEAAKGPWRDNKAHRLYADLGHSQRQTSGGLQAALGDDSGPVHAARPLALTERRPHGLLGRLNAGRCGRVACSSKHNRQEQHQTPGMIVGCWQHAGTDSISEVGACLTHAQTELGQEHSLPARVQDKRACDRGCYNFS